jgi:hypothetical protein
LRAKAQWEEKKCSRFGWPGSSRYKTDTKLGEQLRRDVAACYRWQGLDRNWPWRKFATLFYLSDKDFAIPEGEAAKDPDQLLRLALNFRTAADVWSNIAGNCAKEGRGRPTDTVLPKLVAFARKQGINLRGLAHVLAENRVLPSGRLATEIDDENLPASIEEQEVAWLARLRDCEKRQRRRRGKIPKSF